LAALLCAGGWEVHELGPVLDESLPLLRRPARQAGAPSVLIASGFHGEESAGPWGVLQFIRAAPAALLDRADLSVLPLVNATGFAAGHRFNASGENPNRGYGRSAGGDLPSVEGRVLIARQSQLLPLARDGVLACHEDVDVGHAYAYTFEPTSAPGAFSHALVRTAARHFEIHPDGQVDGCPIATGIVFNHLDGSFEAWMTEQGAAVAACIETPGQQDFARRVAAQSALMLAFLAQRVGVDLHCPAQR
jgi:predicted deacylase